MLQASDGLSSRIRAKWKNAVLRRSSDGKNLNCLLVPKVLRSLAIKKNLNQILPMIRRVDIDNSGTMNFDELCKLLRDILHAERKETIKVYEEYAKSEEEGIGFDNLEDALNKLNIPHNEGAYILELEAQHEIEMYEDESFTLDGFRKSIEIIREMEVTALETNSHFTKEELTALESHFKRYAIEGFITGRRLRSFLLDLFPTASEDILAHQSCRKLLEESDTTNSGTLDFHQFLYMMRRKQEISDLDEHANEDDVIAEMNISRHQAEKFREFFLEECDCYDRGMRTLISANKIMNIFLKSFGPKVIDKMRERMSSWTGKRTLTETISKIVMQFGTPLWNPRVGNRTELEFLDFLMLACILADVHEDG